MTRPRLPINPVRASPVRRGRGAGEPAPRPVPPPARLADGWDLAGVGPNRDESRKGEPWLLDSRQVSTLLGIGRTKVFQLMATRELPVVRIGRCVRVSRMALRVWIEKQMLAPH